MFLYVANNLKPASRVFAAWTGLVIGFKIREEVFYSSFVDEYDDLLNDHYNKIRRLTELPNVQTASKKPHSVKDVHLARTAFNASQKAQEAKMGKLKKE
jgi:hypothetical protein